MPRREKYDPETPMGGTKAAESGVNKNIFLDSPVPFLSLQNPSPLEVLYEDPKEDSISILSSEDGRTANGIVAINLNGINHDVQEEEDEDELDASTSSTSYLLTSPPVARNTTTAAATAMTSASNEASLRQRARSRLVVVAATSPFFARENSNRSAAAAKVGVVNDGAIELEELDLQFDLDLDLDLRKDTLQAWQRLEQEIRDFQELVAEFSHLISVVTP